MSDAIITAEQIQAAQDAASKAASKSYGEFVAAKATLESLQAAFRRQQAVATGIDLTESVVVVGKTYRHRDALKRMGLKWQSGVRGWVGNRGQVIDGVPTGCEVLSHAEAALRSMDHEDSAY